MKKKFRIKKDKEFQAVFKRRQSIANRQFVVYVLHKPDQLHFRVGLSVGKKIGNAVMRNRVKRYIREAIKQLEPDIRQDQDFIIIARHTVGELDFFAVKKSLLHLLKKAHLLKGK